MALKAGSPAIDAVQFCPPPKTDQLTPDHSDVTVSCAYGGGDGPVAVMPT